MSIDLISHKDIDVSKFFDMIKDAKFCSINIVLDDLYVSLKFNICRTFSTVYLIRITINIEDQDIDMSYFDKIANGYVGLVESNDTVSFNLDTKELKDIKLKDIYGYWDMFIQSFEYFLQRRILDIIRDPTFKNFSCSMSLEN